MATLLDFVLSHLPPRPASVLEVGCGSGELAHALAAVGYDVVAIDPIAPDGPIFRRIKLEELEPDAAFDAVVASRAFHHIPDLDGSLLRVAELLRGGGPFVLDEFAWDRIDETTSSWYEGQRRVLLAAGRAPSGPGAADWREHHADVHGFATLREALDRRFVERYFEDVPYLWRYLDGESSLALEETLVATGAIRPLGFRFVGISRRAATLEK